MPLYEKCTMKVGVVTVLYGDDSVLEDFYLSMSLQEGINLTVYVVDNNAKLDSLNKAIFLSEKFKVASIFIHNGKNLGVAAGNNIGIKAAIEDSCDYIVLSNNDIFISRDIINNLLHKNKDRDVIVPKIYIWNTNNVIWYAGGGINEWLGKSIHYSENLIDDYKIKKSSYVGYAPTCFMIIKPSVFKIIGLMDERFFVYYDDTDFAYRLKKENIKITYSPEEHLYHKVSISTGGSESCFTIYYSNRNRIYFIKKNIGLDKKYISILYFIMTRFYYLIKYKGEKRRALLSGIFDGFKLNAY